MEEGREIDKKQHPPHSTPKAQRLCAIRGTASPPLRYKYTGTARAMKAPLGRSCCKTPESELNKDLLLRHVRGGGQLTMWATTVKADLAASLRPRKMEKGLGESL